MPKVTQQAGGSPHFSWRAGPTTAHSWRGWRRATPGGRAVSEGRGRGPRPPGWWRVPAQLVNNHAGKGFNFPSFLPVFLLPRKSLLFMTLSSALLRWLIIAE